MNIVLCANRRVLPGLHVTAFSVLDRIGATAGKTCFMIFGDDLLIEDVDLLRRTLDGTGRPYDLEYFEVNPADFHAFPPMNGNWASYYRLYAAEKMLVDRFLYLDIDILCDMDVSHMAGINLKGHAVGWVAEAPMEFAVDRPVAAQLGNAHPYFNAGVLLVDTDEWRRQSVTPRSMEYIALQQPVFYDQSALNVTLHGAGLELPAWYNCMANMRKNWPLLSGRGRAGKIIHFIDYPKPWSLLGELIHPQAHLWTAELEKTAMRGFRSWHQHPERRLPRGAKAWSGYRKALKDKLLFKGYENGWLKRVKGVPQ